MITYYKLKKNKLNNKRSSFLITTPLNYNCTTDELTNIRDSRDFAEEINYSTELRCIEKTDDASDNNKLYRKTIKQMFLKILGMKGED